MDVEAISITSIQIVIETVFYNELLCAVCHLLTCLCWTKLAELYLVCYQQINDNHSYNSTNITIYEMRHFTLIRELLTIF